MSPRSQQRIAALQAAASMQPHGTRSRYKAGRCRCADCRRANAAHEAAAAKHRIFHGVNRWVSAASARAHILAMRAEGLGYKTLAEVAEVPPSTVHKIIKGERTRILSSTEAKILAVPPAVRAGGARIPAGPTWKILDRLIDYGYTKCQLAAWLDLGKSIQISHRLVTVRNAGKVERLERLLDQGKLQRPGGGTR